MVSGIKDDTIDDIIARHIEQHRKAARLHSDTVRLLTIWKEQRAKHKPDRAKVWTPERVELLRAAWLQPKSSRDVWNELNDLPGVPISSPRSVARQAERLGIRRIVKVTRPKGLTKEDYAEGDAGIRAGWSPAKLADWFGCSMEDASKWFNTMRDRMKEESA